VICENAQPGSECSECRKAGRYADARRTFTWPDGRRLHLCVNHAAVVIHGQNLYDYVINPTGRK